MDCGYSSEPPHQGSSVEHQQSMFGAKLRKISEIINYESEHFIAKRRDQTGFSIAESHETGSTIDTGQSVATDTTGTTITVGKIPNHKIHPNGLTLLPELPSHKFKHSVWHDLRQTRLRGTDLHAPRVRAGPLEKEIDFYNLQEDGKYIHHSLHGMARLNHMNVLEQWEEAKAVNLSFQELAEDYQRLNFHRILGRLHSAITINLMNNQLCSLVRHTFPQCESLNLNQNFFISLTYLPYIPNIRYLTMANNNVKTLYKIEKLALTPIEELTLKGNPISFEINYRQRVFLAIPNLRILDGVPKLPSDYVLEEAPFIKQTCSII